MTKNVICNFEKYQEEGKLEPPGVIGLRFLKVKDGGRGGVRQKKRILN